jgi:hypothetical protein
MSHLMSQQRRYRDPSCDMTRDMTRDVTRDVTTRSRRTPRSPSQTPSAVTAGLSPPGVTVRAWPWPLAW